MSNRDIALYDLPYARVTNDDDPEHEVPIPHNHHHSDYHVTKEQKEKMKNFEVCWF